MKKDEVGKNTEGNKSKFLSKEDIEEHRRKREIFDYELKELDDIRKKQEKEEKGLL